ncbi:MAG: alpha/beta hydrolase [Planctomycetota bacterium]|jgi:esterase/lipase superfamily enzyme
MGFLKREGVAIAYTWPAGLPGLLQGYNYDRESSEFTVFHLKQLVRALVSMSEVEGISLLAHSRGTDGAITALRELVIEARAGGHPAGDVEDRRRRAAGPRSRL